MGEPAANYLLVDAGSSRLKWMQSTDTRLMPETVESGSVEAFAAAEHDVGASVVVSSVMRRGQTRQLIDLCRERFQAPPMLLAAKQQTLGIQNAYPRPERMGTDRWAAIVGAVENHGHPVVVVDAGTATTLDAVDARRKHLGGMIFPGAGLMDRALRRWTGLGVIMDEQRHGDAVAGSAEPEPSPIRLGPGTSPVQAIENGIVAAQVGALGEFLRALGGAMPKEPLIVVTGGGGAAIMPELKAAFAPCRLTFDPWLVFGGMAIMAVTASRSSAADGAMDDAIKDDDAC
jgi:type III pantothenate kinase